MTPRQREFCRHYLRGLSAARAARAAGYSASTAEKNAATILSSESVARYLERHRVAAQLISLEHLQKVRDRMLAILDEPEGKASALAGHAIIRLSRMSAELAAQEAGLPHPQNTAKNPSQPAENQPQSPPENLPETDTLETGQPAHDIRLAPLKAQVAIPKTPVHITFRGLTKRKPPKAPKPSKG